ncbi:cytochrome b-c1 complex subunit 2, mitochondrial-like [Lineus longissimus]|uniref:cytochrome b-c1 complex subunit 2, mitochondrial-like n=1 Tax=Lineus longissimus TaxID=88925 RepID=UPI002B4CFDAD
MRASSRQIVASIQRRLYASQAAQSQTEHAPLTKQSPKVTRLPNGVTVASVENYSPVTKLAVVFKAGARYETGSNLGITHCLRNASSLSNNKCTGFGLTRSINQIGGSLDCTTTREHMIYTTECSRDHVDTAAEYLSYVSCNVGLKPWELKDMQPRLNVDLAVLAEQPESHLIELLHESAFRDTLGRSLYAPEFMVGHYDVDQIADYVNNHYTAGRMALVGIGIEHDDLLHYAKHFNPTSGPGVPTAPAKFSGGNKRVETGGPVTLAAIATEAPSLNSKDLLALGVVQHLMGTGPYVKYSSGASSNKIVAAASQATNSPFAASCFSASYSDSGLFGFTVAGQPQDMDKVLKAAVKQFGQITKGNIDEKDIVRAKQQLKSALAMSLESSDVCLQDLALQAINLGEVQSLEALSKAIDAVSANDVLTVAKKVITGKPTMAAIGSLSNTPYLDQLL